MTHLQNSAVQLESNFGCSPHSPMRTPPSWNTFGSIFDEQSIHNLHLSLQHSTNGQEYTMCKGTIGTAERTRASGHHLRRQLRERELSSVYLPSCFFFLSLSHSFSARSFFFLFASSYISNYYLFPICLYISLVGCNKKRFARLNCRAIVTILPWGRYAVGL